MNHIIIEREKLEHNIHIVKEKAKSINPQLTIIAVIKGNGYGMDSVLIARKLLDNNINFFAVSEISEAEKLRKNGFENKGIADSSHADEIWYNLVKAIQ